MTAEDWGQIGAAVFKAIAGVVEAVRQARAKKEQPVVDASVQRVDQIDAAASQKDLPTDPSPVQLVEQARDRLGQLLTTWPEATRPSAQTVHVNLGNLLAQGAAVRPDQIQAAAQQLAALSWPDAAEGARLVQLLSGTGP